MFQHDSIFFLGVFAFIFILWLVTGGPTHPLSFSGPLLSGPGPLGGGTYLSLPTVPGGKDSTVGQSQASGQGAGSYVNVPGMNEAEVLFGPPSTYRGSVRFSGSATGAGNTNAAKEYVQITLSSNAGANVDLTGWSLESGATGKRAIISFGTEVPTSGIINAVEPIVLKPGDKALIISGRSPIGASFRVNKCMGYFSQFQTFYPSLPNSCPTPETELEQFYGPNLISDASCIDYVDRLNRCSLTLSPPTTLSGTCQRFLTTYLNYNGCLNAHKTDYNFKTNQWRIYLGRDSALWRTKHEAIKLLDPSGKTVDMITY